MSMPRLPENNDITREEAVNLILASIAMEELGMSHILNAEGEKLQYVLGTVEGTSGLDEPPTVEDILDINKSVRQTLSSATRLQMMLGTKMESAMSTSTMKGPTGAQGSTGPQGPTGPKGAQGLEGPRGEQGIQGTQGLQGPRGPEGPEGPQGLTGPTGAQGSQGLQGVPGENGFSGITVRGNYDPAETYSINDYVVSDQGNGFVAHVNNPTGPPPEEFVSNNEWTAFVAAGAPGKQGVQGPAGQIGATGPGGTRGAEGPEGIQGPPGKEGPQGTQGPQGLKGDTGAQGPTGPKGDTGAQGPTGPKGDTGERGPSGAGIGLIPFATGAGAVGLLDSRNGFATNVIFTGFGASSKIVSIAGSGFTLPSGDDFFFPISLAHAITIKSIYFTTANWAAFTPEAGSTIIPYIILATANQGEITFAILNNTRTDVTAPWRGGSNIPANSTLYGSRININQAIPAGARLAICCAFDMKNGNPPLIPYGYYFYYAGSIYYE